MKDRTEKLTNLITLVVLAAAVVLWWEHFRSWVVFFATLGVLIAIHEWGHFIAAKAVGVRVYEFALGMGPKVLTYMRRNGTDYTIRAFPIGGFVHPKGMQPDEPITEDGLSGRRPAERALVYLAGPLMNAILGILVLLFSGALLGTPDESKVLVGELIRGKPSARMEVVSRSGQPAPGYAPGLRVGDRILEVNGKPVTRMETVTGEINPNAGKPVTLTVRRGREELVLTGVPELTRSPQERFTVIKSVPAGTRLAVQPGDQLDEIDGSFFGSATEAPEVAARRILREKAGQPIALTVWRNGRERLVIEGVAAPLAIELLPGQREHGTLGFGPTYGAGPRVSLGESFFTGFRRLTHYLRSMAEMFGSPKQLGQSVGGPVAIKSVLDQVGQLPLFYFGGVLASLSLSLAIFNLLPLFCLDGGHMLLLAVEVLRRRRLEPEMHRAAALLGVVMILCIFVMILWKDLVKYIL